MEAVPAAAVTMEAVPAAAVTMEAVPAAAMTMEAAPPETGGLTSEASPHPSPEPRPHPSPPRAEQAPSEATAAATDSSQSPHPSTSAMLPSGAMPLRGSGAMAGKRLRAPSCEESHPVSSPETARISQPPADEAFARGSVEAEAADASSANASSTDMTTVDDGAPAMAAVEPSGVVQSDGGSTLSRPDSRGRGMGASMSVAASGTRACERRENEISAKRTANESALGRPIGMPAPPAWLPTRALTGGEGDLN